MPDAHPEPSGGRAPYPNVEAQPHFPDIEKRILARWAERDVFRHSIDVRPAGERGSNEFIFYDGPPFANGLPHYGHLITSYIKDIVPRFQTMRGKRVERRFGWDCHGLPAEMEAERELHVSGRANIIEFGIANFNDHCRASVMKYTNDWQRYVNRAARWVDFDNDYKTLDLPYMESLIWALKQLWERGLLYESYDIEDVFERIGSDALRWYLVSSPLMKGGDLRIDQEGKAIAEAVRLVINPIWNAYSFFCLYANTDGVRARAITGSGEELVAEGRARDLVRVVQQARKQAGLPVADQIHLIVDVPDSWRSAIDRFADYVREQTLATELAQGDADSDGHFEHAG
ncbi:MAG: class I tRNA ligase family protein, partial [Myxococcota bacterium]|nr:class I tRNA ligase family protein [Myxococcota bacterium]